MLREEFLLPLGISQYRIAEDSGIVWNTLWYIQTKKGKYPSARILARLEKYFKGVRTNAKNYCDKRNPKRDRVKMAKGHRMRKTFADAATS